MIFQSIIYVKYKSGINDPESINILSALNKLGFESVKGLSKGKFFELTVVAENKKIAENQISQICNQLLANPVIEQFNFEILDN